MWPEEIVSAVLPPTFPTRTELSMTFMLPGHSRGTSASAGLSGLHWSPKNVCSSLVPLRQVTDTVSRIYGSSC